MTTKTQDAFEQLNYFTASKESGATYSENFVNVLDLLSSIYVEKIRQGKCSEEEIEDFAAMLPNSKEAVGEPSMHPDSIALTQTKFNESVKIAMLSSRIEKQEEAGKTM